MIKAIIFDCFGVVLTDALQAIRSDLALRNPQGAREVSDIIAADNRGLMEPSESREQIAAIMGITTDEFRSRVAAGEVRDEALLNYVLDLRQSFKTAMLSNIAGESLQRRFPGNELAVYFDEVIASAEIGFAKPDHQAYEIAAERLGVMPAECVFTDDREGFCVAAGDVGMHPILYKNFAQFSTELRELLKKLQG